MTAYEDILKAVYNIRKTELALQGQTVTDALPSVPPKQKLLVRLRVRPVNRFYCISLRWFLFAECCHFAAVCSRDRRRTTATL
jgi:hypothetical protein